MSGISPAGVTPVLLLLTGPKNLAEPVPSQKMAVSLFILQKTALLFVDTLPNAFSQASLHFPVMAEGLFVDHNLPAAAAGIRTFCSDTFKFVII